MQLWRWLLLTSASRKETQEGKSAWAISGKWGFRMDSSSFSFGSMKTLCGHNVDGRVRERTGGLPLLSRVEGLHTARRVGEYIWLVGSESKSVTRRAMEWKHLLGM